MLCFRDQGCGCDLRRVALDPSGAVVFLHVVVVVLPPPVLKVTVLQVGVDVQVVVHAVRLLRVQLLREVALQLLELLCGEEVGLWEQHLQGHGERLLLRLLQTIMGWRAGGSSCRVRVAMVRTFIDEMWLVSLGNGHVVCGCVRATGRIFKYKKSVRERKKIQRKFLLRN